VARAAGAARSAAPLWRNTPYGERCEVMRARAVGIAERHYELAAVMSLETGKSRTESILEVQEAVDLITTYADQMEAGEGFVRPLDSFVESERNADVLRPYGVFAVISPFNFPAALSINMVGAAVIAGNTVVLKPSEETPWTGAILGQIARAAGLPPGVFNVVQGGPAAGAALVDAPVDGVAFTGSAEVGRAIARKLQDGLVRRPDGGGGIAARPCARARRSLPAVRDGDARRLAGRGDPRGERARLWADGRHLLGGPGRAGAVPRHDRGGRRLREPPGGGHTGAWPGTQPFCGWKSSGSTGKGGLGPWYLPQFMREQSRTIVD
jgi:acyl-CoA reductase-like NAD-dependent aldehyde dehydrogenase